MQTAGKSFKARIFHLQPVARVLFVSLISAAHTCAGRLQHAQLSLPPTPRRRAWSRAKHPPLPSLSLLARGVAAASLLKQIRAHVSSPPGPACLSSGSSSWWGNKTSWWSVVSEAGIPGPLPTWSGVVSSKRKGICPEWGLTWAGKQCSSHRKSFPSLAQRLEGRGEPLGLLHSAQQAPGQP